MSCNAMGTSVLLSVVCLYAASPAAESRFSQTHSRSQYVHWIDLYDANNRKIDPADANAQPYSPQTTCGRCHDYKAIGHGHHFNAMHELTLGRRGEPWIWTDARTGTQLPLSYRGWQGTHKPNDLGISTWDFVLKFGRHLPGGGPGEPPSPPADEAAAETAADASAAGEEEEKEEDDAKWKLSGELNVDCMICHSNDRSYSPEVWWEQIEDENFAWAPTAALGLGHVDGEVSRLPDDFDPATADADSRHKLPQTTYASLRTDGENKVFIDVIRKPHDNACYYCHSTRFVGDEAAPDWIHDEDVHLRAGMSCSDCHRNGIEHHTVRGYEGEEHPTGEAVETLSCRGCHMGESADGGRLGAPKPLHKGLPPLHFEKLACTTCHSGPRPGEQAMGLQTALAHGLGLPSHEADDIPPGIVAPVFMRDGETLYPHRMMWPAFWGTIKDESIAPLNPDAAYDALRRTLRVRRGDTFTKMMSEVKLSSDDKTQTLGEERAKVDESEWTDEEKAKTAELEKTKAMETFREKLAAALEALKEIITDEGAEPVYVSGGKAFRLAGDGSIEQFDHDAAEPYSWKLGHDVRPARWSSGIGGCYECHSIGSPIFEGQVTAVGPAPDQTPVTKTMYELAGFDKTMLDAWNQSFQGRPAFKWLGFVSTGAVALILLSYLLLGLNGLAGMLRRKS